MKNFYGQTKISDQSSSQDKTHILEAGFASIFR